MDVKTLCLGALTLGDASGYEIRKLFEEGPFAHFYDASYGSIYPSLGRLLSEGLVSVTEMAQEGRPDKKVYRLTDEGMTVFRAALMEPPVRDKIRSENLARLFFAEYMDGDALKSVYDGYLREFKAMSEKVRSLDQDGISEGRRFTRGFGLAFYEGVADYMEKNRDRFFQSVYNDARTNNGTDKTYLKVAGGEDD